MSYIIEVNPRRVLENHNYIGIFNSKNIDKLIKKFNILIKPYHHFYLNLILAIYQELIIVAMWNFLNDQAVIDSYHKFIKTDISRANDIPKNIKTKNLKKYLIKEWYYHNRK